MTPAASTVETSVATPVATPIEQALSRGLALLEKSQRSHGEIASYRFRDAQLTGKPGFESSPYATTYVLHSLGFVARRSDGFDPSLRLAARITALSARALSFLAEEMEPPGLWRYYSSRSAKTLAPDLDDTACVSYALRDVHDAIRLGLNLRLFLANRDDQGLFRTFLSDGRNNVDAVVNANVVLYLGAREETRAACRYLVQTVHEGSTEDTSLYGLDELSLAYVLSRAFFHGVSSLDPCCETLISRILDRRQEDGSFGEPFETALALNSLLNLGHRQPGLFEPAVRFLLARQREEDGSWPRAAFYIDFFGGFYGSEELTTAFCLEALARAGGSLEEA